MTSASWLFAGAATGVLNGLTLWWTVARLQPDAPLLSALRTISLGSWQISLKQRTSVQRYGERLTAMLSLLVPHLPAGRRARRVKSQEPGRVVALVVGSERGLVGRFNVAVVERAEQYLAEQEAIGVQVELVALETRVRRIFQRRQRPLAWADALSITGLPPYRLAFDLTRRWLARYEQHELDAVDLVYSAYHGMGRYETTVARLIPPRLPKGQNPLSEPWPPSIIETDPLRLYTRVVEQWAAVSLYKLLLESAAAEHSTRYQLMESATQNADRLIEELTLAVQAARRHTITREMQELAAGAGLIGPRSS